MENLSIDSLREITNRLNAKETGRLWLVGSKIIQDKLGRQGGVEKLDLKGCRCSPIDSWPSFASNFPGLRELAISDDSQFHNRTISTQNILSMPAKLRKLEFFMVSASSPFMEAIRSAPSLFDSLASLTLESSSAPLEGAIWPPNLTVLKLPHQFAVSLDLNYLPRNLIELSGSFKEPTSPLENQLPFPTTLKSLSMQIVYRFPIALLSLISCIPYLTELNLNDDRGDWCFPPSIDLATGEVIRLLPRTLQHVGMRPKSPATPEECAHLPPHLESMRGIIDTRTESPLKYVDFLPKSLTRFPMTIALKFMDEIINKMGRDSNGISRLRHIEVDAHGATLDEISFPSFLFPSLRSLHVETNQQLPRAIGLLIGEFSCLTELTIEKYDGFEDSDLQIQFLPRSLTTLQTNAQSISESNGVQDPIQCDSSTYLPPMLRTLALAPICLNSASWFSGLPTTLTSLTLAILPLNRMVLDCSADNVHLPPHLTELDLRFIDLFTFSASFQALASVH